MRRTMLIIAGVALTAAVLVFPGVKAKRSGGTRVQTETIARRDLESIVSASGKLHAQRQINITSEVTGRVTQLAVGEGDPVKRGQFLLQIDPRLVRSVVERDEAGLEAQRAALEQNRTQLEVARSSLGLARTNFEREQALLKEHLTSRQAFERVENELRVRAAEVITRQAEIRAAEQRIRQQSATVESARYDLSRVTIESPIDGIVIRRNVEEGETAQAGFTNNPSVVLLTLADMSVIEAQIEVDETDLLLIRIGQPAQVTIDALPNMSFPGRVTEIGNSPLQPAGGSSQQATNFRVAVTLDQPIPEVRPGFTCTAEITTARRTRALAVPIQAMAVRELTFDKNDQLVRNTTEERSKGRGCTRREVEGVFRVRGTTVEFVAVKTGIAGDRYFEVLAGLEEEDRVVTGPVASVRELADGKTVRAEDAKRRTPSNL